MDRYIQVETSILSRNFLSSNWSVVCLSWWIPGSTLGDFHLNFSSFLDWQHMWDKTKPWSASTWCWCMLQFSQGWFSIGAIVQNSKGFILVAMAKRIQDPGSVLGAELKALMHGISFCMDLEFHNIQVFPDSLMTVQAVTCLLENLSPVETYVL